MWDEYFTAFTYFKELYICSSSATQTHSHTLNHFIMYCGFASSPFITLSSRFCPSVLREFACSPPLASLHYIPSCKATLGLTCFPTRARTNGLCMISSKHTLESTMLLVSPGNSQLEASIVKNGEFLESFRPALNLPKSLAKYPAAIILSRFPHGMVPVIHRLREMLQRLTMMPSVHILESLTYGSCSVNASTFLLVPRVVTRRRAKHAHRGTIATAEACRQSERHR